MVVGLTSGDEYERKRATSSHTLRTTQIVACEPSLTDRAAVKTQISVRT